MKKIFLLLIAFVMVVSVAFAAKQMITAKDLPGLKGTWEGMMGWGVSDFANSPIKVEILSDKAPIKAKITISSVPSQIASQFGWASGDHVGEIEDGVITTQGTIMWTGPNKNFLEVTLAGDKKLTGWYYFRGVKGDMSLSKKK